MAAARSSCLAEIASWKGLGAQGGQGVVVIGSLIWTLTIWVYFDAPGFCFWICLDEKPQSMRP